METCLSEWWWCVVVAGSWEALSQGPRVTSWMGIGKN